MTNVVNAKRSLSLDICQPLVGRRDELEKISDFIIEHVKARKSGCLYISGLPGVGKTATMKRALQNVQANVNFQLVCINCMDLQTPKNLYNSIHCELNPSRKRPKGGKRSVENPSETLTTLFTSSEKMIVLCLDEIDALSTNNEEVLYSAFKWPNLPKSRLVLIGIANSFDLTERLLPKLRLQYCNEPSLLQFQPYTKDQVVDILKFRTCRLYELIDESAIELCARKVSAVTGDIRKALEICKLAIDQLEKQDVIDENRKVKPKQIIESVNQVYGNRVDVFTIQQKCVLASVLKIISSGSKSFTVDQLFSVYKSICTKANVVSVNSSEVHFICEALEDFRMIRKSSKKSQNVVKYQLSADESVIRNNLNDQPWLSAILQ